MTGKNTGKRNGGTGRKTTGGKKGGKNPNRGNYYTQALDVITDLFDVLDVKTPREQHVAEVHKIKIGHALSENYRTAKATIKMLRATDSAINKQVGGIKSDIERAIANTGPRARTTKK